MGFFKKSKKKKESTKDVVKEVKPNIKTAKEVVVKDKVLQKPPIYAPYGKVNAVKILGIIKNKDGSAEILPTNKKIKPFIVNSFYIKNSKPRAGGYYVVDEEGNKSYQSAEKFEASYKKQ